MNSPYRVTGPAQISFSGGRTSGYMLAQVLAVNDWSLPDEVFATFQNTGKEREETLDFIAECGDRWRVPIHWIEFDGFLRSDSRQHIRLRHVTHATASRHGEPFDKLIDSLGVLPNPVMRICTAYMKVRAGRQFMRERGYRDFDNVLGIRADEPRRVARLTAPGRDMSGGVPVLPLARAGVAKRDVIAWWDSQPFDLRLDRNSDLGNCDLCFLKARQKIVRALTEEPERAVWWINAEARRGAYFRNGRPPYADLAREGAFYAKQMHLFAEADVEGDALIDCMCGAD
jgi:3'-phosphoadenosine 5'-phosphosulfate sulfotransferase (PAPS reductase)/FAD synthetase